MRIHVLYATESMCGMCRDPGWHWIAVTPHRVIRWRGPFATKSDCVHSAANANPCAELGRVLIKRALAECPLLGLSGRGR